MGQLKLNTDIGEVRLTTFKEIIWEHDGKTRRSTRVSGTVHRSGTARKQSKSSRHVYWSVIQAMIDVMFNKTRTSYVTTNFNTFMADIPLIHVTVENDDYIIRGNGGKVLYKCKHGDFKNPTTHDKDNLSDDFFNEVYKSYLKHTRVEEKPVNGNQVYDSVLQNALLDNECLNAYNYLKGHYPLIQVKLNNVDKLRAMLLEAKRAHTLLMKKLNITVYPQMKSLIFRDTNSNVNGKFSHELAMILNYKDNIENMLITYFHEYGHYIHYYYIALSKHHEWNKQVFKNMTKDLKLSPTLMALRDKYTVQRTKTATGRDKIVLSSFGKYMYSDVEVIARMFESYLYYANGFGLVNTGDKTGFTPEEMEIFKRYMVQLKL